MGISFRESMGLGAACSRGGDVKKAGGGADICVAEPNLDGAQVGVGVQRAGLTGMPK